jgi:hypothetical protein
MLHVAFLFRRNTLPDQQLVAWLTARLSARGFYPHSSPVTAIGMEWARQTERLIRQADVVIPVLSPLSVRSDMFAYEVLVAYQSARKRGRPWILPLRVEHTTGLPESLQQLLDQPGALFWRGADDNEPLVERLLHRLAPLTAGDRRD